VTVVERAAAVVGAVVARAAAVVMAAVVMAAAVMVVERGRTQQLLSQPNVR